MEVRGRTPAQRSRSAFENEHPVRLPSNSIPKSISSLPPSAHKSSAPALRDLNSSTRVTRSSARHAASLAASSGSSATAASEPGASATPALPIPAPAPTPATRKRKDRAEASPHQITTEQSSASRRSKRQKRRRQSPPAPTPARPPISFAVSTASPASKRLKKGKAAAVMSNLETPADEAPASSQTPTTGSASRASRNKRTAQQQPMASQPGNTAAVAQSTKAGSDQGRSSPSSIRRSKRIAQPQQGQTQDVVMSGTDEHDKAPVPPPPPPLDDNPGDDSDENVDDDPSRFDDEDEDPFGGFGGPGNSGHGIHSTLRALTGIMSSITPRLRELLAQLQQIDDPSVQLIALQDLSEILLMSLEDNLQGQFSPDAFVKELVALMQPNELTGEENPEIMLLACRCLFNLMEALPSSTANVVYGGAVPILCQKLLEISFIDLAEQALSTLEKISIEYPQSIVREGGLTACLSYLDFFATSTQRTAVTTAANCCRSIPEESFPVIRDVMPTLLQVLNSSDARVVEQASLCVSRIVESFKYHPQKLEELFSVDLLKAILRLLLPSSTNMIGSNIHTQFLRVLAFTARASPRLSAELFKMNVVETLYQILTGVSPPSGTEDVASKLDSVLIMQALIHRPRDQILETLNVICELLPSLPKFADPSAGDFVDMSSITKQQPDSAIASFSGPRKKQTTNEKRIELLESCKEEVRRFALILFPTLTDAFSSTVNLSVRQKVLTAQLKMLSNLDEDILGEALKSVPYASFLASILSQQDHPSLIMSGLQATELLMSRLDTVYRYQLYREGVIVEITKLANQESEPEEKPAIQTAETEQLPDADSGDESDGQNEDHNAGRGLQQDEPELENEEDEDDHDEENGDDDHEDDHEDEGHADDMSATSEGSTMSIDGPPRAYLSDVPSLKQRIKEVAKKFLETHETEKQGKAMKKKATKIMANLSSLSSEIEAFYLHRTTSHVAKEMGLELFGNLASYFDADVLESVTSAELLASGIVRVLEQVFSNPNEDLAAAAQSAFLQVFMGYSVKSKPKTATADSPATPLSVMIHKLQDVLSRSEHFEVITVHNNSFEGNRSSAASMLAKQIRLRLVADEDSEIPRAYRNIMVSMHAISTFKSLDEYLRPRMSLAERARVQTVARRHDSMARHLAALASSAGLPLNAAARLAESRLAERLMPMSGTSSPVPLSTASTPAPVPSNNRAARKSKSRSQPFSAAPATPEAPGTRDKTVLRRSTRRQAVAESPAPPHPPPNDEDDLGNALECADEKQISEDEEMGEGSALSVMRDLDDDMDEASTPDPSAVNLEVATSGKITARNEDGTRVPTPSQSRPGAVPASRLSALTAALQGTPTPGSSSRPMSYAAAIQAVPQDWHIEFSLDGKVIPNETTVYRAVHSTGPAPEDQMSRSVWAAVHPIKYRKVPGPPPSEPIGTRFTPDPATIAEPEDKNSPASLTKYPTTASILRLLKKLHDLNANIDDVLVDNKETLKLNVEPLSQFVNTKLTAKLNRQLEEPLIVASNALPSWSEDLARLYPFLFPFETRHLFLQSTSFGYARSMNRWQNAQSLEETRRNIRDDRPFLGRLQRQKVRISRSKILESGVKVMELYGTSQSILEVEYFDEVGTGLGPTLEFYSTVSREFSKKQLRLWRDNDLSDDQGRISGQLFPRPMSDEFAVSEEGDKVLQLFRALGKFVARSMLDSRIIDLNFNPIFFRISDEANRVRPSLGAVKAVDPVVARSLMTVKKYAQAKKVIDEDPNRTAAQKVAEVEGVTVDDIKIDALCIDFTLPGYPDIELVPNGSQIYLSMENVELYLEKVVDLTLGRGVRRQVDAFRTGFSQVFPHSALSAFTPDELCALFGRNDEDWSLETLTDSIKADHGYNMDSKSVRNLLQIMSELNTTRRRDFLQFTTGSPKLPIGGFRTLNPMFTVVCKPSEAPYTSDDYLPSVMTCVNYLKLPDYTDVDIMRKRLFTAIREGQGAFHLS